MKIAVIGPQNTGKSTFIKDFLVNFDNYISPKDTYRNLVEEKELTINQETTLESQKAIRDFLFMQVKTNTSNNIIFDRCVIDNYIYTYVQYEAGLIPKSFVEESYTIMLDSLKYIDMYIFIPASLSVVLVDDKLRDTDRKFIDIVNQHFLRVLFELAKDKKINVKIVSGSREDRIAQIKKII